MSTKLLRMDSCVHNTRRKGNATKRIGACHAAYMGAGAHGTHLGEIPKIISEDLDDLV